MVVGLPVYPLASENEKTLYRLFSIELESRFPIWVNQKGPFESNYSSY